MYMRRKAKAKMEPCSTPGNERDDRGGIKALDKVKGSRGGNDEDEGSIFNQLRERP